MPILIGASREVHKRLLKNSLLEFFDLPIFYAATPQAREIGAGERMMKEGFHHDGIILRFDGRDERIDFPSLTGGKRVTIYAQHDVNKDLIKTRLDTRGDIRFEAKDVSVYDLDSDAPKIPARLNVTELPV